MNARDAPSAFSIVGHSSGVAERLVLSRNTCSARRRYQGVATSAPSPAWSDGASLPSAA